MEREKEKENEKVLLPFLHCGRGGATPQGLHSTEDAVTITALSEINL